MSDSLAKIKQYENIEAILYQVDYSNFDNFIDMENYLESAERSLDEKINDLSMKMESVQEELVRTGSVYEMNNKKRKKEEQLLSIERDKIKKQLTIQKERLNIKVHPMTLILKEKKNQIQQLIRTKQIIQDFTMMLNGNQAEISKTMSLEDKNFRNSAMKIYVFKALLDDMNNPAYDTAKLLIKKKYSELKNKIVLNFKEGYLKKDLIIINNILPYCEEYDLMEEICDFYNDEAFKESHKLVTINTEESVNLEIRNFFFLIEKGFNYAFNSKVSPDSPEKNIYQINTILVKYSEIVSRKLITFSFERLIKQSIDNVLKSSRDVKLYLKSLQNFYTECKLLVKNSEKIIANQRVVHLMMTYFQSIFEVYLDSFLNKELNFLKIIYQESLEIIMEQIKSVDHLQQGQEEKSKKFSFKKLMDYKIQPKKGLNPEYVKIKLNNLSTIFTDPSLEKIFEATKASLNRNNKISKINDVDKNRDEILTIFIKDIGQLVEIIIQQIAQLIPPFQENVPPIEPDFFLIVPQINILLQRMQFLYTDYKKQAKYQLSQSIKLEQKKQNLITKCQKDLHKIVGDVLACILISQKCILKSNPSQYLISQKTKQQTSQALSLKLISYLDRYLKPIQKISQSSYKAMLLRTIGLHFINLLIQHYSNIHYNKEGLSNIYIDIANYKRIITLSDTEEVDQKYQSLKSLIDIYVIKNDQRTVNQYIKTEKEVNFKYEKDQVIRSYVQNKQRNQKHIQ